MRIKLGTIILHKRTGPFPWVLSRIMRLLDPDPWVRHNFKIWGQYWHMSFVCGYDPRKMDWIVRSISGKGIEYRLLSSFKDYTAVDYLDGGAIGIDQDEIDEYCDHHPCRGYDAIGYIQCALNRLSRGWWSAVRNRFLYCWEDVAMFCESQNKPWHDYFAMPYMPCFVKIVMEKLNSEESVCRSGPHTAADARRQRRA